MLADILPSYHFQTEFGNPYLTGHGTLIVILTGCFYLDILPYSWMPDCGPPYTAAFSANIHHVWLGSRIVGSSLGQQAKHTHSRRLSK